MMTTNIFEMITMKTQWAPAKSNWGYGEVGDTEEQVGGGEGGQQAVEHRPHLPGGVYQDQHLYGGGGCYQDQHHKLLHNFFSIRRISALFGNNLHKQYEGPQEMRTPTTTWTKFRLGISYNMEFNII